MQRPDLNTLTFVNPACQLFRHAGAKNLVIRKVYGRNRIRPAALSHLRDRDL